MLSEKQFDRLYNHYCRFFGGEPEPKILHPQLPKGAKGFHLDMVLFEATAERPYQVLATIGASEYAMKGNFADLSNRNEYVTFVPADWNLSDPQHRWLLHMMQVVAAYPREEQTILTYAHDLDLSVIMEDYPDTNMAGAVLLFPEDYPLDILRCKTGLLSTVTILHMMPITQAEMDAQQQDRDWCSNHFYPEDAAEDDLSFLCARNR